MLPMPTDGDATVRIVEQGVRSALAVSGRALLLAMGMLALDQSAATPLDSPPLNSPPLNPLLLGGHAVAATQERGGDAR